MVSLQSCVSSSGNGDANNRGSSTAAGMSSGGGHPSVTPAAAAASNSGGGRQSPTEPLKLGSLTETWKQKAEWNKYVMWLDKGEGEGEDSDGKKMSLGRYARYD